MQVPHAFLRKECAAIDIALPPARRVRRRHGLPAARRAASATSASRRSRRSSARRARSCSAGARCRSTTSAVRPAGAREHARDPPDLHRPRPGDAPTRRRSSASSTSSASASSARCASRASTTASASTSPACRRARIVYKGLLLPEQIPAFYPDLRRSRHGQRAGAGAPALQHQHASRRGTAPIRTASSRTTARSTRCAATSTGCTRAQSHVRLAAVRRRHQEDPADHRAERHATRRCSTTRSSCSCAPAARCRTR